MALSGIRKLRNTMACSGGGYMRERREREEVEVAH
jgi:hypothetical protein